MVAPASVAPVSVPLTAGEPLALALQRLAAKAHAEGLTVLDDVSAAPFSCRVTSSRELAGEAPYVVNLTPGPLHGCGCKGYERHQRCKHYALCLELAGWLPDPPDDPPPAAPLHALPRPNRRELASADLAARYPSLHPARSEDAVAA